MLRSTCFTWISLTCTCGTGADSAPTERGGPRIMPFCATLAELKRSGSSERSSCSERSCSPIFSRILRSRLTSSLVSASAEPRIVWRTAAAPVLREYAGCWSGSGRFVTTCTLRA